MLLVLFHLYLQFKIFVYNTFTFFLNPIFYILCTVVVFI